jgi:PhoPQ-activated pathogenicity-related protein
VVAELGMVPNQPLAFADGQPRHEDSLIAYTWDQFLRSGDPLWLARLPMTKSAVRAMDTITDFCAREETGAHKVESFVVAGGSKRGWTTWTTAAVDDRVVAAVPIVIDLLNIVPSFRHHYRVYGRFAPAVDDYVEFGVMDWMGTPEFAALLRVVGPYQYRNRFTMPKFLINACGDQFFVPDSWQFYLRALPAETMVRYVPNADHGLGGSDAVQSLGAFYHAILNGIPRPEFEWQVQADGSIRVETATQPLTVRLWQATNPEGRDFREDTIGDAWSATDLEPDEPGVYVAQVPEPETGWTAFMVELRYDSGCPYPFTFTTGVSVTPNTYPYPAYEPKPRE